MLLLLFWMRHLGYLASSVTVDTSLLMHSRLLCGEGLCFTFTHYCDMIILSEQLEYFNVKTGVQEALSFIASNMNQRKVKHKQCECRHLFLEEIWSCWKCECRSLHTELYCYEGGWEFFVLVKPLLLFFKRDSDMLEECEALVTYSSNKECYWMHYISELLYYE